MRYADAPWGPWSEAQIIFGPETGYGIFIHDAAPKLTMASPGGDREGKVSGRIDRWVLRAIRH